MVRKVLTDALIAEMRRLLAPKSAHAEKIFFVVLNWLPIRKASVTGTFLGAF